MDMGLYFNTQNSLWTEEMRSDFFTSKVRGSGQSKVGASKWGPASRGVCIHTLQKALDLLCVGTWSRTDSMLGVCAHTRDQETWVLFGLNGTQIWMDPLSCLPTALVSLWGLRIMRQITSKCLGPDLLPARGGELNYMSKTPTTRFKCK